MHIAKIELENIKSHVSSTIEFSRGTTAITGENGAGKTTIIEAIAWVLFDLIEYKKEDFLRRGAKKGFVRVTIQSGLDDRQYTVHRDTGTGYFVTDPRLQMRVADKKEEVLRFLWQHLGLEPGTDLRSLFRQAIGVPQGTFTAIFLEGATERKTAFDRLLKVEEYRQAAEKLRDTSRFVDLSIAAVREDIARAEGELSRSPVVEAEFESISASVTSILKEVQAAQAEIEDRQARVKALDEVQKRFLAAETAWTKAIADKQRAELVVDQAQQAHGRALTAVETIEAVKVEHQRHLAVIERLTELESTRARRDELRRALTEVDGTIIKLSSDLSRYQDELSSLNAAKDQVEELRPKAQEQARIEVEITGLREGIAKAEAAEQRIRGIDERLARTREKYRENLNKRKLAESSAVAAAALAGLEEKNTSLVTDLASLRAALERDEKFHREVQNGLCPILSQRCLNLSEDQTLEAFLSSQFTGLKAQIESLETERARVSAELSIARQGLTHAVALESYRDREAELREEGEALKVEQQQLQAEVLAIESDRERLRAAEARLAAMEDPSARIRVLEADSAREGAVRTLLSKTMAETDRQKAAQGKLVAELEPFADLDSEWRKLSGERDATLNAHRAFLANEQEARALAERAAQLESASKALATIAQAGADAERDLKLATTEYDAEVHKTERDALAEVGKRLADRSATLEATKKRQDQLAADLHRFRDLRRSLVDEFREKERLEKVAETTAFIRDTLKDAAPRIARNYVHHVSLEANQMFREITGNGERTLKWAEDYSIVLEESGFDRPFVSLSGGEQMSAALAVRLGLLKQLSDIRIAFFDEPTTNMDAERRENFAQQISRITHFDQMFVISHDDTFDNYVDDVIAI